MIRINKGPLMQEYADCFGCEVEDVRSWVDWYVNNPDPKWQQVEPTEKERLDSIKGYIQAMVNDSVTRRIKASISAQKALGATK